MFYCKLTKAITLKKGEGEGGGGVNVVYLITHNQPQK